MIKINNLCFGLANGKTIINNINCNINHGDFIILLGSNGSGKSSLVKCLNKDYIASSGTILLNDIDIKKIKTKEYSKKIVTLTQFTTNSLFYDLTIAENAYMIASAYHIVTTKNPNNKNFSLQLKNYLATFNSKLAQKLHEPLYNLSGGEQQILAFALYLQHQPELLLLDEHTSALDPKTAKKVMQFTADIVEKKNLTCIMTTHNLDFALQYGNRVIALKEGQIAFDSNQLKNKQITRTLLLNQCY